jgi:hypothetical protein
MNVCKNISNLVKYKFNDLASSARVGPNTRVIFYQHINYRGKALSLTSSYANFVRKRFNDMSSSLKISTYVPRPRPRPPVVTRPKSGCVIMYEHTNYRGKYMIVCGSIRNFVKLGWNDRVSSVKVGPLTRAVFYEHVNYRGRKITRNSSHKNFVSLRFNDLASSVKIYKYKKPIVGPNVKPTPRPPRPGPTPRPKPVPRPRPRPSGPSPVIHPSKNIPPRRPHNGCVILFEHCGYKGRWIHTCRSQSDLNKYRFARTISSIRVGSKAEVKLFSSANYRGHNLIVVTDIGCLVKSKFNDRTVSYRVKVNLPRPRPRPIRPIIVPGNRPTVARTGCVVIYEHTNYRGKYASLCGSVANTHRLKWADNISSARVGKLTKALFYQHINFKGKVLILLKNEKNFVSRKFNDMTSSIKIYVYTVKPRPIKPVVPRPRPIIDLPPAVPRSGCVIVFQHINYQGKWLYVCGSVKDLRKSRFNNLISSVKVGHMTEAKFYDGFNFRGKYLSLNRDNSNLVKVRFNDLASSIKLLTTRPRPRPRPPVVPRPQKPIKVAPNSPRTGCVLVFQHIKYSGRWAHICGSVPNLAIARLDNAISSLKVGKQTKVILYSGLNYTGRKVIFIHNNNNMVRIKFNDVASSLRLFTNMPIPRPRPVKPINVVPGNKPAPARPTKGCVIIFEHVNYNGRWAHVCGSNKNLGKLKFRSSVSSVKVGLFSKVIFYSKNNFKGKQLPTTRDIKNLVSRRFNDQANSLRLLTYRPRPIICPVKPAPKPQVNPAPFRPRNGCAIIYQHINYKGRWAQVCGSIKNLNSWAKFDNIISSIKLGKRTKVILYSNKNFKGRHLSLDGDDRTLVNKNFNDITSSIKLMRYKNPSPRPLPRPRPVPTPPTINLRKPSPGCVRLFQDINYKGRSIELCYSHPDFRKLKFNDVASSAWVGKNTQVSLYEHVAYGGRYVTLAANVPNFLKRGWLNDRSSSAKLYSLAVRCTKQRIERVPSRNARRPIPGAKRVKTFTISGTFKDKKSGRFIRNTKGFSITAQGKDGKRHFGKFVGGNYLFQGLAKGKYEFIVSAPGRHMGRARKIVNSRTSKIIGHWDWKLLKATSRRLK